MSWPLEPLPLAIFCALAAAPALCQQYPFLPVPGSPKNALGLFQDSQGRIWAGGQQPACFDGANWFFLSDYGLPPAFVYQFSQDPGGTIWVASGRGIYRFANGRFEEVIEGHADGILAVAPDLAIATMQDSETRLPGAIRIQREESKWKAEFVMRLHFSGHLAISPDRMLLMPMTTTSWAELPLKTILNWRRGVMLSPMIRGSPGESLAGVAPMGILRDHSGCTWLGTPAKVYYDCGAGVRQAAVPALFAQYPMREGPDGNMLLLGNDLLAVGRPGSFRIVTAANGLPSLSDALRAADGTIWLSTSQGLYRFATPFGIEYWTGRDGISGPVWATTRIGRRMYVNAGRQILVLNKQRGKWTELASIPDGTRSLLATQDGRLFAGLLNGNAIQLSASGHVIARTEGGKFKGIIRLAEAGANEVWLGGNNVLTRIKRRGGLLISDERPIPTGPVGASLRIKYEDRTRKLFACFSDALIVRGEHDNWKRYTAQDGLRGNGCWSVAPLANGDIWYLYHSLSAIALIRPGAGGRISVRNFNFPETASGDTLDADRAGRLWRSWESGIYVATPGQAQAGEWLLLNESDGFPTDSIETGSLFTDTDGTLWWGAENNLVHMIPPPDLVTPRFAPQVFVSAFSWNGERPKLAEAVGELPHGSNVIAHIGSLQFDRGNALRFRYRVLPAQSSWRETRSADVVLGALSTGQHTLEVQGRIFTGPWSAIAGRSFSVPRPFWLARQAVLLYAGSVATLAWAMFALYLRRRAVEAQVLPDLAPWRTGALASDVHEITGALLDSRFEVGNLLARGGFANVMEGYDRRQKRPCAIKVFRTEVRDTAFIARSFDHEVAALEMVRHPNVVPIYAWGRASSGAPFLVMEFVEGRSLREVLNQGALPPRRVARFLKQLAGALDAIHARGICHRDVKPENVIVRWAGCEREQCVLIDFSIAIIKDADETLHGLSRAAGTFDYMAPEQAIGHAQPSSDVYSLARVLIEMLTGHRLRELLPGAALDLSTQIRGLMGSFPFNLSQESIDMIATSLEFDPARRPVNVCGFAAPLLRDLESDRAKIAL
ncbi:MAG TPA: protein kinase [Bryobacteraceae bacterium]|nr:protein kinase [Bryobacteraceae bacterium]